MDLLPVRERVRARRTEKRLLRRIGVPVDDQGYARLSRLAGAVDEEPLPIGRDIVTLPAEPRAVEEVHSEEGFHVLDRELGPAGLDARRHQLAAGRNEVELLPILAPARLRSSVGGNLPARAALWKG